MIDPYQANIELQVEKIHEWKSRVTDKGEQLMLIVTWIRGDKQWMSLDDLRLHDPYLLVRYALKNKLTGKPGWEWSKYYLESDQTLKNMVHAYKASRFLKNIKFGVEVPRSTKHALDIDKADGTNLWKEAMNIEIKQLHSY